MDFNALLNRLKSMPGQAQWRLLGGLALIIIGVIAFALWGLSPEYAPLYTSLPEKESGGVISALEQNNYPYKLSSNGTILVERGKVYEARYKLASLGIPKNSADESGTPPKFGASSSQEQAYQQKTKEIELSRSINSLAGVSGARVHLAIPHQSIFGKETTTPTASVVIDTLGGISKTQATAIAHLVANANPGMKSTDVSIIDGKGKLLTSDAQESGDTPEQRAYVKEIRTDLQSRVERLLEPLVGKEGAKAEIDVLLEFGNEEAVTETWKPNAGEAAIRSQQTNDNKNQINSASGIPGSSSNTLPLTLPPLPGPAKPDTPPINGTANSNSVTNYELDRSVVKSIKKGVKIRKIRAAVLVDYKKTPGKDGKITNSPLPANDIAKITALVQESIGIDEDRGDSVQVINMQFTEPKPAEDISTPLWKDPYYIEIALMLAKWGAILFGLMWLGRTAQRLLAELSTPEKPANNTDDTASSDPNQDEKNAGQVTSNAPAFDINSVKQIAQGNPQAVASVIKGWVEGDGNE